MGWYGEQLLPRLLDVACATPLAAPLRARVCAGLTGEVVEIGFGSGLNVPHYPATLTRVAAVEPSDLAWGLAADRVAGSPVVGQRVGLDAQALPLDEDTFDSALSTWTLCTIPDARAALAELRRVLRPGGRLPFVGQGLGPDASVARWQRRLEPVQERLAGGCHLTRRAADLIDQAGFDLDELDVFYQEGAPKVLGALTLGVAST